MDIHNYIHKLAADSISYPVFKNEFTNVTGYTPVDDILKNMTRAELAGISREKFDKAFRPLIEGGDGFTRVTGADKIKKWLYEMNKSVTPGNIKGEGYVSKTFRYVSDAEKELAKAIEIKKNLVSRGGKTLTDAPGIINSYQGYIDDLTNEVSRLKSTPAADRAEKLVKMFPAGDAPANAGRGVARVAKSTTGAAKSTIDWVKGLKSLSPMKHPIAWLAGAGVLGTGLGAGILGTGAYKTKAPTNYNNEIMGAGIGGALGATAGGLLGQGTGAGIGGIAGAGLGYGLSRYL